MASPEPARDRPHAAALAWRTPLGLLSGAGLLFLIVSGLWIYAGTFGLWLQANLLLHVLFGVLLLPFLLGYLLRHWRVRRGGVLSHFLLLGYFAAATLLVCLLSGLAASWQALVDDGVGQGWRDLHLASGLAASLLYLVHLGSVLARRSGNSAAALQIAAAQHGYLGLALASTGLALLLGLLWARLPATLESRLPFPADYNWRFGADRPFAPSLARVDDEGRMDELRADILAQLRPAQRVLFEQAVQTPTVQAQAHLIASSDPRLERLHAALAAVVLDPTQSVAIDALLQSLQERTRERGAITPEALAGSAECGRCHAQIYAEWLPSAHRYAAMDDLFQRVQQIMAVETSAEHTRYCAGCHDPISLFSGAKDSANLTLSAAGSHEGLSCVVCHSIVQADVQGNADFTLRPPPRYLHEGDPRTVPSLLADFLVRSLPAAHVSTYSRPLYKRAEYCGACHKQYMDSDLNTDIGRVQGQNQFDSWARSRWNVAAGEHGEGLSCRECHMPLVVSDDPAAGDPHDENRTPDDGRHRSHRFLGGNQFLPALHQLEGADEQLRLTEAWLRGEIEIPEIADRWASGPVVRMAIEAPARLAPGERARIRVILTNNKTGHDFPTGPLDMIESWVELQVSDAAGRILHHSGGVDEADRVVGSLAWFKADGFDREGGLIDRHNLWDLVGKRYARSLYPGMTDMLELGVDCPSLLLPQVAVETPPREHLAPAPWLDSEARPQRSVDHALELPDAIEGPLTVEAILWYRKVNPDFLDLFFAPMRLRAPLTEINRSRVQIEVGPGEHIAQAR
jgi:hypothetical protein